MEDIFSTIQPFVGDLYGSAGHRVSLFQIINDISDHRLFTLIARKQLHADGNLICIKQESQTNNRFFSVFLGRSFFPEIIFPVDLKVKVSAVKVSMRGIKLIHLLDLMIVDFNDLFVFATDILQPVIELV